MPTFGKHQTAQRRFLSGVGAIYALEADAQKVIKVLQPADGVWSEVQLREEIDVFLLRAKTQRAIAKQSKNWAPVYEISGIRSETTEEYSASGAFAIFDRYERSVQSLIEGRVNLTNDDLRTIMSGVIQALIDSQKAAKRPHGSLKPSNILLANSAILPAATILLSDPAPDGALNAASNKKERADVGRILYELVNLRPYSGGTIGRSKDWDRLGPNGEDWRKLCNVLVDPAAPADEHDFEKILPRISTWTLKPPKSKAPLLIAASVLLVIVLGGGAAYYFTRPPKLDYNQANWEKLCLANYAWYADFSDHFGDNNVKSKFANAPYPSEIVSLFNAAAKDLDNYQPKKIAGQPSSPDDLAINPTQDAKTGYGPYYTKQGDELIDKVAAALTPDHWPILKSLDKTAGDYEARNWKKPAAAIRVLIEAAKPPEIPPAEPNVTVAQRVKLIQPKDVFSSIDKTIQANHAVGEINAKWTHIQDLLAQLPKTDVPLLNALPQFASDLAVSEVDPRKPPALEDVTSLAASFTQIETLITQLETNLAPVNGREIVFAQLARDPAAQLAAGAKPTMDSYTNFPAIAKGYLKLASDPRDSVNWNKSLDDLAKETISVINEANPQDPNLKGLQDRHAELTQAVAKFDFKSSEYLPPIEKFSQQIADSVAAADKSLASLTDDAHQFTAPYIIDPAVYIAQQKAKLTTLPAPLAKATPAVLAEWKKAHTAFLAKVEAAPAQIKNWKLYKTIDVKFVTLEQTYADFDTKIPAKVPGLSDLPGSDWRSVIATRVATVFRENALREIMTNPALKWSDDLPQTTDPAYLSYQQQRLKDYEKTRTDTLTLLADFTAINDQLDHLRLRAQDNPGAPLWKDLFAKWTPANALLTDGPIVAALKPIADRVTALLAVDPITDYKTLLDKTADRAPEIVLTSWRKLGDAPVTEETPVLDDEDKAEAALTTQLAALGSAKILTQGQADSFTAEIADQRPLRWHHWAEVLATPAAIQSALDRAAAFKVTLTAQRDSAMFFNQTLYALRKDYEKNLPEAQVKPIAQTFITQVSAMPAAVSGNKDIQDLLARMTKPLQQSDVESSSAGAGPKLAGWDMDNSRPEVRIFISKTDPKRTLEFDKVTVTEAGSQKTIFICTTEMSVGLFIDTINDSGKFADLDNTGKTGNAAHWFKVPARAADDIFADQGVRAWKIADKKFALNPTWLSETAAQMIGLSYYPDTLKPAPPSPDDPMQLISPWSAMYAARLLGCRLPTPDEWQAAYVKYESVGQKDAWNLRGEGVGRPAWRSQQDYSGKMGDKGMKYPDQNVFIPPDKMFDPISAKDAKPWLAADLAKIAAARISPPASATDPYKGNTLWFRKVGNQPGSASPGSGNNPAGAGMHDLVGNVAEYVFDGPNAIAVIKDNIADPKAVDAAITAGKKNLAIIGGSSLSPPEIPFNKKQDLDPGFAQSASGFTDVGFRLAYTAPIDSIVDVLAAAFKDPKYLPGPKAKPAG